ncbi:MAG: hypothetical protein E7307_07945 [Butyrivibrio sp.]|nr:hypothetical protein [Butyrivibrio sp.]
MPRRYTYRDEKKGWDTRGDASKAYDSYEAAALANTDFDAIYNPITAFNFVMEVEGLYFLPIKTVRAFTKENEFEYIKEGGVNDYIHLKRKPISKPFTFQIERYIGTERFLDPLALGTELILPLILYVYRHKSRAGLTASAPAWPARIYTFQGCTVMSKEYGELNAEKSGLLTETTTIAYRELVVINNGFQSLSEEEEWNAKEQEDKNGPGYTNRYAAFSPNDDTSKSTYWYRWDTDKDGHVRMSMKDDAGYKFRSSFDIKNKKTHRGNLSKIDADEKNKVYEMGTVDGKPTLVRKGEGDLNRPQYELSKNGSKLKYINRAYNNPDADSQIYKKTKDKDGIEHLERIDKVQINKKPWDGSSGYDPKWAKPSAPDKNNTTYDVIIEDGKRTVKRKDSDKSDFNAGAYSIRKNKTKNHRAEVSPLDAEKAEQRVPYSIRDGAHVKHAKASRKDSEKPEVREPYSIKDGATPKHSKVSPTDSQRPEVREPYSIKDGATPKHSKVSPTDSQKPEVREQYRISEGAKAKYASVSPKDSEKPTPVIWPPTRRALMADNLKK